MKITIVGTGYLGLSLAVLLAAIYLIKASYYNTSKVRLTALFNIPKQTSKSPQFCPYALFAEAILPLAITRKPNSG